MIALASPALAQTVGTAPADPATAAYAQGVAAENAGRHDEAIADLDRAIAFKPDFAEAYATRAVAEDQKGLYSRAVADYSRAIALGAATAETYFNRGAAYEHHRSYPNALADYRAALTLDPGLQIARDGVKRLGGGR